MKGKVVLSFVALTIFLFMTGCSSSILSWKRAQQSAHNAVVDPMTWAPAIGSVALYTTKYDNHATQYFMDHKPIQCIKFSSTDCADRANDYRLLNSVITFTTAVLINDEGNITKKLKRVVVEESSYIIGKSTVDMLESVGKKSPDGTANDALASHHALEPFAGSAMTRRNVSQMNIPAFGKYAIVGVSYYTSTYAALTRVQDGAHSLGDQFVNMAVGNFLGLFIHDLFMLEDGIQLNVVPTKERVAMSVYYHF
ncbi:hypothetical protein [Sulfurimonas sp.]|uniref:hypothetical protein n=1 Tax=Sulfurimonas sp. TaxID=2022749 RepID=UPI002608DE82|nr:hypothetical protein [Sulfurimonas sp.]